MQITVKTQTGKTLTMEVSEADTVKSLKDRYVNSTDGMPPDQLQLVFAGRLLEEEKTLQEYNIHENSTLSFVLEKKPTQRASFCSIQ